MPTLIGQRPEGAEEPTLTGGGDNVRRRPARAAAGVDAKLRPFHDLRHASLTNGAAAGEGPIERMTRAGHANMATTKRYRHLAGTTFPDAAAALAERMLGVSTEPSTDLSEPEPISDDLAPLSDTVSGSSDPL